MRAWILKAETSLIKKKQFKILEQAVQSSRSQSIFRVRIIISTIRYYILCHHTNNSFKICFKQATVLVPNYTYIPSFITFSLQSELYLPHSRSSKVLIVQHSIQFDSNHSNTEISNQDPPPSPSFQRSSISQKLYKYREYRNI